MARPRGLPKTGGRRAGVPNKRSKARKAAADAVAKRLAAVIPEVFQGDAHAYLMAIYKDPAQETAVRIDAAKAALPYEKPRLVAAEAKPQSEEKPLAERLAEYEREAAIEASDGRVIEIRKLPPK